MRLIQNFSISNFKIDLPTQKCVGGTQFFGYRGVIDYDLSDGPVEKIFRRPYKFPVLFRTGANTLPLKILHFYFSALKIS